ncbi:MAG: EAL domain-containing protein [Butyrivibrio sp.]|nr:EAL domain-containing protein [Butyrivibrio sp.]
MLDLAGVGSITFNLAAIIISVTCVFYTLVMNNRHRTRGLLFVALCSIVALDALTGIFGELIGATSFSYETKLIIIHINQFIYFLTHFAIAPMFAHYIILVCNVQFRFSKFSRIIVSIPFSIMELMVILIPVWNVVYRIDENLYFRRRGGVYFAYVVSAFYILFAIVTLFLYWNALNNVKRVAIIYYFILVSFGTLLQMAFIEIRSELMAEAIGFMGLMMMLENDDDRIDVSSKAYNRNAFTLDTKTYFKYNRNFYSICIRIRNGDVYRKIAGYEEFEKLLGSVVAFLSSLDKKNDVYRVGVDNFILLCPEIDVNLADYYASKIKNRFSEGWNHNGNTVNLKATILEAASPSQFASVEYLFLLSDALIDFETDRVLSCHDLDFLLRRADVEKAVKRGIEGGNFRVYYNPIYTRTEHTLCAAEAYLKLNDKELGTIEPDEFLPVAEQTGLIDQLGYYTIDQVLYFLGGGIVDEMGIEFVDINLSSIQIIQANFAEKVNELLEKNGVPSSKLVFSISETVAASDKNVLTSVMKKMSKQGIRFFMNDYGTGFYNMQSSASFIFEGVKINASLLRSTGNVPQSRIILENRLRMIGQMGKKIVIVGVNDQDTMDALANIRFDYLQGEYLTAPVSKNEIIAILKATEISRMEERRAKAASEAKSNFLANMSHEIRTPINAVLGMNEVILRECKDENILEYAQNIEAAGKTLLSLINDILDFSKIEAGSMEIHEAEYELSSVLNDIYNMISIKAQQKALSLVFEVDKELPDKLFGDEMRFRQVVVNILNNAIKYTKEGSVTLNITGEKSFDNMINLKIDISDTGMGIKKDDLDSLFEKFKRLDEDKNKTIEGSGLGLAITASLLELMGGSISVDSDYGKGSTFTIILPQKIMEETPIGDFKSRIASNIKERKKYKERFTAPNAEILVVDDTPMNHVVIRELLKPTKIRIESARSGAECLERQHNKRYDIIFLDYRMPGMDGTETFEAIKKDAASPNAKTPIIVLTANAISGARDSFLKVGFDDYLSKPIESDKLEATLIKFLPKEKVVMTKVGPEEPLEKRNGTSKNTNVTEVSESGFTKEGYKSIASDEFSNEEMAQVPNLEPWMDKLEEIDASEGLKNCGSPDSYLNILKVYYESIESTRNNIENAYEERNWKDYTSYVHSLKSTSRTVGAMKLSKLSAKLEEAGNKLDLNVISNYHTELLNLYSIIKYSLDSIPEIAGIEEESESKQPITPNQLKDAYNSIIEVSQILDFDTLTFILDSLKNYSLPSEDKKTIGTISELAYKLKWDEVIKTVENRLKDQE